MAPQETWWVWQELFQWATEVTELWTLPAQMAVYDKGLICDTSISLSAFWKSVSLTLTTPVFFLFWIVEER